MKDNSCIIVQCAIVQTCNHSIWCENLLEWLHCVQLASQHMLEREILILADRNIHISSSLKTFSTGSNTEALWKKKSKCQESFRCCLQQNVPGCDAIVRLCRDASSFCQLFQQGASSISLLYLCQHSGRDIASRVNDEQWDRWFLLSTGVMAPSLVSVIEPGLTDRQDGRPLHSCRPMMTFRKKTRSFLVRTNWCLRCCLVNINVFHSLKWNR